MTLSVSNTDEKYLISHLKVNGNKIYLIRRKDTKQDVWLTNPSWKYALSKCKLKILELIHQEKQIELTKNDIFEIIIQATQEFKHTKSLLGLISKCQKEFLNQMQYNFNALFDPFKPSLVVTPFLWKNCYRFIKQPQLFQVVGRIFNKKSGVFYYLMKYKYFDDHSHLLWTKKSNFYSDLAKTVIDNFDAQNPRSQKVLFDNKYSKYQKILKQKLFQQQKVSFSVLIGKARIKQATLYLSKRNKQTFQSAQWYMTNLNHFPKIKVCQINAKIKRTHYDCNSSPFIDRKTIKKLILQEISKSPQKIKQQKQENLTAQDVQRLVDQKIQLFMVKYQRLKKEIESYCEGIQIFDKFTDSVKISTLRQKINSKINELENNENNQIKGYKQQSITLSKKQFNQESFVKQQQYESDKSYDSEFEVKQEHFDSNQQANQQQYAYENQQIMIKQQQQTDSLDFYQKIKKEYNEQDKESKYFQNKGKNKRKIKNSQIYKRSRNLMKKKLKDETKKQDPFYGDDQSEVKKEEVSTASQLSSQTLSTKKQEQKQDQRQKKEVSQTPKIKKIEKFLNTENNSDVVYRVHFEDGRIYYGTQSDPIQKQGISLNKLKK